jgi:hypothetical protein
MNYIPSRDMAIQKFNVRPQAGKFPLPLPSSNKARIQFQQLHDSSSTDRHVWRTKMSLPARAHAPSRALLSALTRTNAAATTPTLRRTAAGQRRWESTEQRQPEQHGRSFKGQLYESTTARLEKEREDRKRFARHRNEGAGGRNAAMTFGSHPQPN